MNFNLRKTYIEFIVVSSLSLESDVLILKRKLFTPVELTLFTLFTSFYDFCLDESLWNNPQRYWTKSFPFFVYVVVVLV